MNSRYERLLLVKIETSHIKKNPKQLILTTISCMCDNLSYVKITRNKEDEVSIRSYNNSCNLCLSNLQMKDDYRTDLEWAFLDNEFDKIVEIINSGTSKVESLRAR